MAFAIHHRREGGFTLIELVSVIIILGVLSAVAVPKFVDMSTSARVATVKAAAGAVSTASVMAGLKCRLVDGCYNSAGQGAGFAGPDGVVNYMWMGFPTGTTRPGAYFGIRDWVAVQDFSIVEVSAAVTEFTRAGAPDPSNCKVIYQQANDPTGPTTTSTLSGC